MHFQDNLERITRSFPRVFDAERVRGWYFKTPSSRFLGVTAHTSKASSESKYGASIPIVELPVNGIYSTNQQK
jgi:hypothetical protein